MARVNRFDDLLRERGIEHVLHFTRLENLAPIFANGIVPRTRHAEFGLNPCINDPDPPADHLDAVSLSVSYFNWPMFRAVRDHFVRTEWAILFIDAGILPGSRCEFYAHNAASGEYLKSMKQNRSLHYFEDMFADTTWRAQYRGPSFRAECNLADNMTTDPQAEILYRGIIDPRDIVGIWVEDADYAAELDAAIDDEPELGTEVFCGPIAPRVTAPYYMAQWG